MQQSLGEATEQGAQAGHEPSQNTNGPGSVLDAHGGDQRGYDSSASPCDAYHPTCKYMKVDNSWCLVMTTPTAVDYRYGPLVLEGINLEGFNSFQAIHCIITHVIGIHIREDKRDE